MTDWLKLGQKVLRFGLLGVGGGVASHLIDQLVDTDPDVCTIHDVFGHTGAYVVRRPGGGTKQALHLSEVSATPLGARSIGHLQIGEQVYCVFPERIDFGYIVGAVRPQVFDGRFVLPDSLIMRSMAGFIDDPMHHEPYQKEENDLANFSGGGPIDSLQGDKGWINEMGVAVWVGKLMAQIRASDVAKIEAFWGDDLLRIFGYNYEHFTSGSEHCCFDDEGEYSEVTRSSPFPWEALGAYEAGIELFDDFSGDEGGLKRGNEKSRFEPKEDNQVMAFRSQRMRGYLGDGDRSMHTLLPVDASGIAKTDDAENFRGVLEIHKGLDGGYSVRSAKEILLQKSLVMPVARQLFEPDDPSGDTSEDYKASNQFGDGASQEKPAFMWDGEGDTSKPTTRAVELLDYYGYLFGKYGLQTLDAHEKDWETPDAEDIEIDSGVENKIDDALFAELGATFSAPLPQFGEVVIDQRDEHKTRYYQTRSMFHLADDGSVYIEDGWGSQIVMSGGNIIRTCMGDVIDRPGRDSVTWAPRDVIQRAGRSADMSASKGSIRLKAEEHLLAVAGNGGEKGALLLECRAEGELAEGDWREKTGDDLEATGIYFKAANAPIDLFSKDIFIGTDEDADGFVGINAGRGQAVVAGGQVGLEVLNEFSVMVGSDRSNSSQPPQFNIANGRAQLRSQLDIVGDLGVWPGSKGGGTVKVGSILDVKSQIRTEGTVLAVGHFQSEAGGEVTPDGEFSFEPEPQGEGSEQDNAADGVQGIIFVPFDDTAFGVDGPGLEKSQEAVGFTFRTTDQLKIEEYGVIEARWQQFYRAMGNTKKWDEPTVDGPDGFPTRPHPGFEGWTINSLLKVMDPSSAKNFDYSAGRDKKREEQEKQSGGVEDKTLEDDYIINVQDE